MEEKKVVLVQLTGEAADKFKIVTMSGALYDLTISAGEVVEVDADIYEKHLKGAAVQDIVLLMETVAQ